MRSRSGVLFLALVCASLTGCQRNSGEAGRDAGDCATYPSLLPPPAHINALLQVSNVFLVAEFSGARLATREEVWGDFPNVDCSLCYRIADLVEITDRISALPRFADPVGKVVAFCDRCFEGVSDEWVCDGGPPPRDQPLDAGCWQAEVPIETCRLPEWHYIIPDDERSRWAVFLLAARDHPKSHPGMVMRFAVEDGAVDLGLLEGGRKVSLGEMAQYLLEEWRDVWGPSEGP